MTFAAFDFCSWVIFCSRVYRIEWISLKSSDCFCWILGIVKMMSNMCLSCAGVRGLGFSLMPPASKIFWARYISHGCSTAMHNIRYRLKRCMVGSGANFLSDFSLTKRYEKPTWRKRRSKRPGAMSAPDPEVVCQKRALCSPLLSRVVRVVYFGASST